MTIDNNFDSTDLSDIESTLFIKTFTSDSPSSFFSFFQTHLIGDLFRFFFTMANYTLPSISDLKKCSSSELSVVIAHLFEPTSFLTNLIYTNLISPSSSSSPSFSTYPEFIECVRKLLLDLPIPSSSSSLDPGIANVIGAHPRLGAKKVDSAQSQKEQSSLQRSPKDLEKIRLLNSIYERTFPGLRYVVFVNARPLDVIADNMIVRIERNDFQLECKDAFNVSETFDC